MPGKTARVLPLLLPALVCIPVAAALVIALSAAWRASDARAAAEARRMDAALYAQAALADAVKRQQLATDHLARSPLVWLWIKFQGQRLTSSNRSHAANSLLEIANYAGLQPGSVISMGSARTMLLYRDGAPLRSLKTADPGDAWYFDALKTDSLLTMVDATGVRTSARLMDGGDLLGAITSQRAFSDLAADIFPAVAVNRGLTVALADAQGNLLFVAAPGGADARTLTQLFPGASRTALSGLLSRAAGGAGTASMEIHRSGTTVGISALPAPSINGVILVTAEVSPALPGSRWLALLVVFAACVVLAAGALWLLASQRISGIDALLDRHERESQAALGAFTRIDAGARSAQSAAANLRGIAGSIAKEAAAGETSGAEAVTLFRQAEDRDAELRSGIAGRLALMDELADSIRAALAQSRGLRASLLSLGPDTARAEEELTRVVTTGSTAAAAVDRATKVVQSLQESAGRLSLMAVNASIEAVKGGAAGQRLSRVAEEVRAAAEDAGRRAEILSTALTEASESLAAARKAAQEAGAAVHTAAAAAEGSGAGPTSAWEATSTIAARLEEAGISAGALRDQAVRTDRGRSALEGMNAILSRVRALAAQAADLAGSVVTDTDGAARAAAAVMKENDERQGNR